MLKSSTLTVDSEKAVAEWAIIIRQTVDLQGGQLHMARTNFVANENLGKVLFRLFVVNLLNDIW